MSANVSVGPASSVRTFYRLPIEADQGFPQSFRLEFEGRTYRVLLYVNVPEPAVDPPADEVLALPDPVTGAYMVMRVTREGGADEAVIFQRKLVTGVEYEADELAVVFRELKVARRNLNGIGMAGSNVTGGIAPCDGGFAATVADAAADG